MNPTEHLSFRLSYENGIVLLLALTLLGIACGIVLLFVEEASILRAPSGSLARPPSSSHTKQHQELPTIELESEFGDEVELVNKRKDIKERTEEEEEA